MFSHCFFYAFQNMIFLNLESMHCPWVWIVLTQFIIPRIYSVKCLLNQSERVCIKVQFLQGKILHRCKIFWYYLILIEYHKDLLGVEVVIRWCHLLFPRLSIRLHFQQSDNSTSFLQADEKVGEAWFDFPLEHVPL